jgi:hypothetical protein
VDAPAGRPRPSWATYVYYYLAALVGLFVIVSGAVNIAQGLTTAIFPEDEPTFNADLGGSGVDLFSSGQFETRDTEAGLRDAVGGILTVAVGVPVFWWHLNEARRREGDPPLKRPGSSG